MLSRFIAAAVLAALCLSLVGCYGSKESDSVAYVQIIGVDVAAGGKRKITTQIAVPLSTSKGGGPPGTEEKAGTSKRWVFNTMLVSAPAEEANLLRSTMSRSPRESHVSVVIFSEEIARQGLGPDATQYIRNRDYRETLFMLVVTGTAEDYMKHNNPALESSISKYYELFFEKASETGTYLPSTLHEFYTRLKTPGASPYAAYTGINPMTGIANPVDHKQPEQKADAYLPGGIPRTGTENPAEFSGLVVFRADKMVGVLNSYETRAVAILQNKLPLGYIAVVDPLKPEKDMINLAIRCEYTKITADLDGGMPIFNAEVKIDGDIYGISSDINYEAPGNREILEQQIADFLKGQITAMLKHTQELGTDPVGFGLYLRPKLNSTKPLTLTSTSLLKFAAQV
ncbi:MAG: gerBC 1 [Firmicutes bacterium]|nr:gerBC 1 [Bacillota bacterium]